ncbi:MAG: ABC transporter ATP-binding protein [Erysipelotrichaceae bacterium]
MKTVKYFKKYVFISLLAPLFKFLEAVFELLVPLVIADIVDIGIANKDIVFIEKKGLLLFGFAILGFCCTVVAQYFASKVAVQYSNELRISLFQHIQELSVEDYQKLSPSSLIVRLTNDTNQIQNGLNLALRLLLRSPIIVFGAFVMAARISLKLSLTFLATILLLLVIVFTLMLISIPLFSKVQNKQDDLAKSSKETIVGIRAISAFNLQQETQQQFEEKNNSLFASQLKSSKITILLNPITYFIINIGIILVIYQSGIQVNLGNLTSGQTLALYNYMSQILVELIKLANLIIQINKAIACLKRAESILTIEPKQCGSLAIDKSDHNEIICFKDVCFHFPDSKKDSLSNISFSIAKGSITAIIGATGSGKSTIINLLNKFYSPTEGEILLNGSNINDLDDRLLHNEIAYVPQKAVLLSGTVRSNLLFSNPSATETQMMETLKKCQCDFIKSTADLDKPVAQFGNNFSGGQKQRLSIARAMIKDSSILILDDSTSALDYATEKRIREVLLSFKGQKTIIIISQRISSISFADNILLLNDGQLVANSTHQDLLANCDLYKEIYNSQNKKENHYEKIN